MKQSLIHIVRILSFIAVFAGSFILSSDFNLNPSLSNAYSAVGISPVSSLDFSFLLFYLAVPIFIILFTQPTERLEPIGNPVDGSEATALEQKPSIKHNVITVVWVMLLGVLLGYIWQKILPFGAFVAG